MTIRRSFRIRIPAAARMAMLAAMSLMLAGPAPAVTAPPPDEGPEAPAADMAGRWELTPAEARVAAAEAALDVRLSAARTLATTARDPVVDTLIDWVTARNASGDGALRTIKSFLETKGYWPKADALRARMDDIVYRRNMPTGEVIAHFEAYPPVSAVGRIALVQARLDTDDTAAARAEIVEIWRHGALHAATEKILLDKFSDLIGMDDHAARLSDRLYAGDAAAAMRQAKRLSENDIKLAKAVLALAGGNKSGLKLHNGLPKARKDTPVLRYALTRYHRLADNYDAAREVALGSDTSREGATGQAAWWVERRVLLRDALKRDIEESWRDAYELARTHGHSGGLAFVEGEFLSGLIALRFLHMPKRALGHFQTLRAGDEVPLNVAQAEYWLGRSYASLDRLEVAREHFRAAAALGGTFYGQLSRKRLGLHAVPAAMACDRPVPAGVMEQVRRDELVQAARLLREAGADRHLRDFFMAAIPRLQTGGERAAATMIATEMTQPHIALRIAKASAHSSLDVRGLAYPVTGLDYQALTPPPEEALIYSVIRQESEFNPTAVSHAGARGLMQIMPGTAKSLARLYKRSYSPSRLVSDPHYNITLGAALLHELVASFGGSYPMALAGYNAGPGRVREWLQDYGDPRKGQIALVDWIEAIPYSETRNYVKRVMENLHVYRARLAQKSACVAASRQYAFN